MSKWIEFEADRHTKSKITKVWTVISKEGNHVLGWVKWYSGWRRYCFFPQVNTIFEQDCLRDIADFIENQTRTHKAQRKLEKITNGGDGK
jgi:hypothetical protein